jgi:predicted TIM-barrel fold metal-dependent hydrolase
MRKRPDDEEATAPFPTAPVSNMEWCPLPLTPKQRLVGRLIEEETTARAKRHGMTRAQFLRTAAATATAFMVMNKVYGLDQSGDAAAMPVRRAHCDDPDAARELLDTDEFIMDVQQHHVDLDRFGNSSTFCFLQFLPSNLPCPESIGQLNYIKEVFVDSHTNVGVISGLPFGIPLGPSAMAATRDLVNELAGSERALSQAVCDPKAPAGAETAIDTLDHQVNVLKGRALKCYTYSYGGWRLDDEAVSYPMLTEAQRLGIRLVNVHKGLPAIFAPGSPETVRTTDFPKVLADWPKLKFCAYHSGYFQGDTHPEHKNDITEFLEVIASVPKKQRKRIYAEIGSTFAINLLSEDGPNRVAHLIGKLLKALGPRNILWGTDSVWWGSPQFLIDAFKNLEIPASMQEQFGYPPLTAKDKKLIFGMNAARLYGVKPKRARCTIPADRLSQLQVAQGGARANRSLRWYGPQTRREFFAMLARAEGRG